MAGLDGQRDPGSGPVRDFVGYGRHTPAVRWPGEASLVVNIVVNYESGGEYSLPDGDGRNDTWGEYSYQIGPDIRDLGTETHFEFGSRAGIWRLARLFDRYRVPVTVGASGRALERNPAVAEWIAEAGHDVLAHGWRWAEVSEMTRDEERDDMRRPLESIERLPGQRPLVWDPRSFPRRHTPGPGWCRSGCPSAGAGRPAGARRSGTSSSTCSPARTSVSCGGWTSPRGGLTTTPSGARQAAVTREVVSRESRRIRRARGQRGRPAGAAPRPGPLGPRGPRRHPLRRHQLGRRGPADGQLPAAARRARGHRGPRGRRGGGRGGAGSARLAGPRPGVRPRRRRRPGGPRAGLRAAPGGRAGQPEGRRRRRGSRGVHHRPRRGLHPGRPGARRGAAGERRQRGGRLGRGPARAGRRAAPGPHPQLTRLGAPPSRGRRARRDAGDSGR